jgi:hypothetical protein
MVHSGILQGMMCGNYRTANRLQNDILKASFDPFSRNDTKKYLLEEQSKPYSTPTAGGLGGAARPILNKIINRRRPKGGDTD